MSMSGTKSAGVGKIDIKEAVQCVQMGSGEIFELFYDRQTGNILEVPTEEGLAYIDEKIPPEEQALWDQVAEDEHGKRFIKLPTEFEINEWDIMRRFADSLNDAKQASLLSDAMRGGGAFGRFKNSVTRLGLEQLWETYRDNAVKEIMLDWCDEHGIQPV
jgi:hypothetical protein